MTVVTIQYTKTDTILKIDHVTMRYGNATILRDVNAEIKDIVRPGVVQGQIVGFLGPSGVGKTQLSRIIAGLQQPTAGCVWLDGKAHTKGRVGMVAQNYILFEWATVLDNLRIAGRQGGLDPKATGERITFFRDTFGLGDHMSKYPKQLSGGTRQRVAIAQQMMCNEHFLVLDEPFSGLDIVMKRRACETIVQAANLHEKNTIIVVTHDVTEAASIADTLWLLGLEKDGDTFAPNKFYPGARIVEQYDLAEMGLCWRPDIVREPDFIEFVNHVKDRFATLKAF